MNDPKEPTVGSTMLSEQAAEALDALVESSFDTTRVPGHLRVEAERIARLLAPVGKGNGSAAEDDLLVNVTLARVFRETGKRSVAEPRLVPDDEEALDAWVNGDYRTERVPGALRARAQKHEALATLATASDAMDEASGDLVAATLARVQGSIDREREALQFEPAAEVRGWGSRLAHVGSIAAMLLIGASVVWPLLGYSRAMSQQAVCQTNLGSTAFGLSAYAANNRDALPMVTASMGGGSWWDVTPKTPRANSANLFHLARERFVSLANLACPGNPSAPTVMLEEDAQDWRTLEEISYSYQIMFGRERPVWTTPSQMVVLSDRSPVVLRSARVRQIDPLENSPNHGHRGQHVLMTDGSTLWATSPILDDRDNIWLPRPIEDAIDNVLARNSLPPLRGTEVPASATDAFVGP